MTEMEKLFEKILNMELTNEEMFEQCRNVAHKPMTNEEYLRSCTTEQLAEFLADRCNETVDWILHEMDEHAGNIDQDDYWYRQDAFVEWLKQPHQKE